MESRKLSNLHRLGQYDGFWVRRFNTMISTGNGAGLILLANYMNKDGQTPLSILQSHVIYFFPFLIGLFSSAFAVISGMRAESSMLSLRYTLEEPSELGYAGQIDMVEHKLDAETKYYGLKRKSEALLFFFQVLASLSFLVGIVAVGFL